MPGLFTFTPSIGTEGNGADYYKGKIAILVNETTQSSAEYHTMAFRTAPNAKVFGSTTAGADGNVSEILLPGNISTMISGIGVYYPDGTETQRIGIVPDVEIKPTVEGIKNGKDEVLDKALEWIKS
jgi:C-terminal processing protease CtpA/Prc